MESPTDHSQAQSWPLWWQEWMMQGLKSQIAPYLSLAPSQPILPGWMIGNSIYVTEKNSSSPDTERDIVDEESYGRQLGRLLDAVAVLIGERPKEAPANKALDELEAMRRKIEQIKSKSAAAHIDRLRADLARLKHDDPEAYRRFLAKLAPDMIDKG